MPTFGLLPSDIVANSRGDVLGGVTLSLYATQADADASTGLLATVTSDLLGRWSYAHATLGVVWVRTPPSVDFPSGSVYALIAPEAVTGAIGITDAAVDTKIATQHTADSSTYASKNAVVYRVADYADAAATITAAPASSVILFPPGNTSISSPLAITKPLTLRGSGAYTTRIVATGCNAIEVSTGITDVHIENIEIACAVRHTTTANTLIGVKVNGTSGSHPSDHTYRDVFIDGFRTGIQTNYLWSSVLDNVRTNFGLIGLDVYGLSVNNFVSHGQWQVGALSGSRAIRLAGYTDDTLGTVVGSEGWHIHDNLTCSAEVGIELIGYTNCDIHDNILDFNMSAGVRVLDNLTNFGGNHRIAGNYIAMTGASGDAAIKIVNGISNAQNTYNRISENQIIVYSGSTCTFGIKVDGSNSLSIIRGNVVKGFATNDIWINGTGNIVSQNVCLTSGQANKNIYSSGTFLNTISDNVGVVYMSFNRVALSSVGGSKDAVSSAVPTVGTWAVGDRCRNSAAAVGSPKGWVCTVAGTPGTWYTTGDL